MIALSYRDSVPRAFPKTLAFLSPIEDGGISRIDLPFYSSRVQAGFPSPADEHQETALDLHDLLIQNPTSTFLMRFSGLASKELGIRDQDILIVDRSLTPKPHHRVVAVRAGEFVVERLSLSIGVES